MMKFITYKYLTAIFVLFISLSLNVDAAKIKTLLVTGQNNHNWKVSHANLKAILENSGLFTVDVAVSSPQGGDMNGFSPDFKAYRLVVLDYNGDEWSAETQKCFVEYAENGGGIVVYHAACAAFPQWEEYNRIIGLGGWNGRNEQSGPWIYLRNGEWVKDLSPGAAGSHGAQHEFVMTARDKTHPVTKGLPEKWKHASDELYDRLRGPGDVHVLCSAYSDKEKYGGSGREEPLIFTVNYGKARIFHTALGHAWDNHTTDNNPAMQCTGFQVTLLRGCEWAATGKVTQAVPSDFPTAGETSLRPNYKQESFTVNLLNKYPIIYVTREQYRPDHHNTATMFQKGEINERNFRGGSSLRVWNPKDNSVKILLEVPEGIVRDPCLSFDATKLLVAIRRNIDDDYHIYELQLDQLLNQKQPLRVLPAQSDNDVYNSLRQLTFLSGVSDIDPLYLPAGEIAFSSTREPKYCMCNRHIMCNLYKMNGDGSNIRQIGKSTLFEGHASLTPDGRIIYDRWEYVDRNFGDAQGVWATTTDGFNHAIFWGNNSASPGGVIDARIVPGSSSVFIATFTSCHDRPWGAIALVDRQKGIDGRQAVLQTWPASAINLVDDGKEESFTEVKKYDDFARVNPKLEDPFPLTDDWFLASGMTGQGERMGIYLLGRDSSMKIIHDDKNIPASHGCFDPMPLKPTTPPPVNIHEADYTKSTGDFYVINVYEGLGMNNVKKGSAKFLRVVESPEKQTWSAKGWSNGHGEQAPGMNWYEFINKRVLGTVPIEEDGSVSFTVPADTFLYFQLLDEQGRMIQTMRSGIIIRPGEINGCTGCHEDRLSTVPLLSKTPKALTKPPQQLKNRDGSPRLFSYVKEVQEPVFDKYCIQCHDYGKVEQHSKKPNLAGDLNTIFNTSYVELYEKNLIKPIGAGPHVKLKPYTWGSTQSRIAEVLINGHPDPEIDAKRKELGVFVDWQTNPEVVDRVFTWIDLNAPYYPVYLTSFPNNRFGRSPLTDEQLTKLAAICGYGNIFHNHSGEPVALDWAISFTRPEMSPCLAKLSKSSAEYKEALAIITAGKNAIETTPRGENPNNICVPQRDAKQKAKYDFLLNVEHQMRKAIANKEKMFDFKTE